MSERPTQSVACPPRPANQSGPGSKPPCVSFWFCLPRGEGVTRPEIPPSSLVVSRKQKNRCRGKLLPGILSGIIDDIWQLPDSWNKASLAFASLFLFLLFFSLPFLFVSAMPRFCTWGTSQLISRGDKNYRVFERSCCPKYNAENWDESTNCKLHFDRFC